MSVVFRRPTAVAVSADTCLYVADRDSNGLFKFDPDGNLRRFYQSGELGNLKRPRGLCFDSFGRLLVTDSGNGRILIFDDALQLAGCIDLSRHRPLLDSLALSDRTLFCSDLNHHVIFAIDLHDGAVKHTLGGAGSGTGRLRSPRGMCVVGDRLIVADRDNDRICVFDLNSGKTQSFLGFGRGRGFVRKPTDVKFIDNRLYVNDSNNYLIQAYTPEFEFLFQFGGKGAATGEFDLVSTLCAHQMALYICDRNNDRILRYRPERAGIETLVAPGFIPGVLRRPCGAAVDQHDRIYVADRDNDCLQVFTVDGRILDTVRGVSRPTAIALTADSPAMHWVVERGRHQLSLLKPSGERIQSIRSAARGIYLTNPHDIAMDAHGRIIVADSGNRALQQFNRTGDHLAIIDMAKLSGNPSVQIRSVCTTPDGSIYTADFDRCCVYCLNPNGTIRWLLDLKIRYPEINALRGVTVHENRIIACVRGPYFIYSVSFDGQLIKKFGSRGNGLDQFRNPVKAIRMSRGDYLVVDKENDRLVVYDDAWTYRGQIGNRLQSSLIEKSRGD